MHQAETVSRLAMGLPGGRTGGSLFQVRSRVGAHLAGEAGPRGHGPHVCIWWVVWGLQGVALFIYIDTKYKYKTVSKGFLPI